MHQKVYELINQRINAELYSAYLYMSFADHYEEEGLSDTRINDPGCRRTRSRAYLP